MALLKKEPKKEEIPPPTPPQDLGRTKVLEDKISNLDKKTELIEDNILSVNKRQNIEIKALNAKVLELEKEVDLVKKRVIEVVGELNKFASKEDLDTMKKYLDLWEPLDFVSRKEFEESIEKLK